LEKEGPLFGAVLPLTLCGSYWAGVTKLGVWAVETATANIGPVSTASAPKARWGSSFGGRESGRTTHSPKTISPI